MAKTTGLASIAGGGFEGHRIDPRKLTVRPGWNSRNFDDPDNITHIEDLSKSIAEKGVVTPIRVNWEDGKAYIINGECRWRACMLLINRGTDVKLVPVIADDRYANDADRLFMQFLENTGKPFTDLERAKNFKTLLDLGWKQEDIAKRAGKTQGWVSQTLSLLTAPSAIQKMITERKVSPSLAMSAVREHGDNAAAVLQEGAEAAKADGSGKVRPEHVGKLTIKKAVTDAFESSDIDNSDDECTVIKMPTLQFEILRNLLKL